MEKKKFISLFEFYVHSHWTTKNNITLKQHTRYVTFGYRLTVKPMISSSKQQFLTFISTQFYLYTYYGFRTSYRYAAKLLLSVLLEFVIILNIHCLSILFSFYFSFNCVRLRRSVGTPNTEFHKTNFTQKLLFYLYKFLVNFVNLYTSQNTLKSILTLAVLYYSWSE